MKLDHGRTNPLRLTPVQHFQLFAILFIGNVLVLFAILNTASKHKGALDSIARSAAAAAEREAEKPPVVAPVSEQKPSTAVTGAPSFRVSVPPGWQTGCRVESGAVEVSMTPPAP